MTSAPDRSSGREDPGGKQALLEAYESVLRSHVDAREAARLEAEARRARAPFRLVLLLATACSLFFLAYLWVERPAWVFPSAAPPEAAAVREASLRIVMANAAQHVERYRQQQGRLPETLADAGADSHGLAYVVDGGAYTLDGESDGIRLTYHSAEPLARFVGNSFSVIFARSR